MKRMTNQQNGFTILELTIATMIFSAIFLTASTALLQMGKLYYKGAVGGRTQEIARGAMDQIAQQLQFSSVDSVTAGPKNYVVANGTDVPAGTLDFYAVCIGGSRYTYRLNAQVVNSVASGTYTAATHKLLHALWHDSVSSGTCVPANLSLTDPSTTPGAVGANGEEVMDQRMRLSNFSVSCNTSKVCTLTVGVIYGDDDLVFFDATGKPTHCETVIGNQWCATSQFSTSVLKRIGN